VQGPGACSTLKEQLRAINPCLLQWHWGYKSAIATLGEKKPGQSFTCPNCRYRIIQIFVRTLDVEKEPISLEVRSGYHICRIKQLIHEKTGTSIDQIRLIFWQADTILLSNPPIVAILRSDPSL
jgi:hypothetical protein